MAIINNNVQNVKFLRNGNIFTPKDGKTARQIALESMNEQLGLGLVADGAAILGRYQETNGTVKTLVGFAYIGGGSETLTVIDTEGSSADVEELRQEINAKLGNGITSGNTATAQLAALSGNAQSTSAETSVAGAKKYADNLIESLDYTDAAVEGQYVSQVTQADGKIAVTRVELPSSADTAVAKKFVTSVAENKGQIVVSRGEISSSAETMVLADNTDGGVNFEVNIDNNTIIQDAETKKLKVADAALVQYEGDTKTIAISPVQDGVRTVSSIITLSSVTPSSTTVKEEYALKNASGETIGSTIKIYKDSSIVEINYITDPADEHYQNLEYIYIDASGNTQTEYVDMSSLILETEFESGVTFSDGVAHGVVDQTSENFLSVGAGGFKLSGVQDAIDAAVNNLDATVTDATSGNHVTITIEELDGKLVQSGLTIEENDIASASDLAGLSAKTVTALTSTNGSITAQINDADGCKTADIQTDADKIKMSGFSADNTSVLSGISESDSIATAFEKTNSAVTGINGRLTTVEDKYISGVAVNGNAVTVANHVAPISITAATSAATGDGAIVVTTDDNGAITLGISTVDCGYYN